MALARSDVGARLLVLYEDRVLLANRRGQTWYFLPGGLARPGETIEDAARREAGRQTGLDIGPVDLVGCTERSYLEDRVLVHEFTAVFAAPLPWAAQIISNDSSLHLASVALDDLDGLELRPAGLTELVQRWLADRRPRWRTTLPAA